MVILLVLYFIFLLGFIVYSVAGVYHLWRFGYVGDLTKPIIILYVSIAALIIIVSLILIATRDWETTASLF